MGRESNSWSPGQMEGNEQDQSGQQNSGGYTNQDNEDWSPGQAQEAGPTNQNPPNQQNSTGFSEQNNQYNQPGTSTPDSHTDKQRQEDREWLDKQGQNKSGKDAENRDNSTYTTPEKREHESESGRNTTDE
jgi:hypothetical protein